MSIAELLQKNIGLIDDISLVPQVRKAIFHSILNNAIVQSQHLFFHTEWHNKHSNIKQSLFLSKQMKQISFQPLTEADLPSSLSTLPVSMFDRLGNVATILKGQSPIQNTKPGKYPLVVTAENRSTSEIYHFEGASAIIPLVSSTGHGDASLKRIHYQEGKFAVGNILAVVQPICPDILQARFIYEYLSAFKEELLVSRMSGTANVSLTINKLMEVPIPIISHESIKYLPKLMQILDQLEAQLQARQHQQRAVVAAALARASTDPTPAHVATLFTPGLGVSPAELRQLILALAVQGKLVPQEAGDEPAEVLLGDIATCLNGDRSSNYPSKNSRVATGIPFINAGHLVNGFIDYTEMDYITEQKFVSLSGGKVQEGDLLYCLRGSLGKCAIVKTGEYGAIASSLMIIRPKSAIVPEYLYIYLVSYQGRLSITQYDNGSAQPNLSAANVKKYPIPLPPLAEQRRIVARVDALMALVDQLEAQQAQASTLGAQVLDAVVGGV